MEARASGPWGETETALAGFDQAAVVVAVLEGPDHRVAVLNRAARQMAGGRDLFGHPIREVPPELAPRELLPRYDEVYRTGTPFMAQEWRIDRPGPDGRTRPEYLTFMLLPWRDADGEIAGVIAQGYDVTEEVRDRVLAYHRAEEAEDLVTSMQDALLPGTLPLLPGLDIAARYLIASEEGASGGDWFDAVLRPGGRVALVVGDVVGHGVTASAVMGQLRAVLHAQLLGEGDLAGAFGVLESFARNNPDAHAATICVVELDVATGSVDYCTAGHPPPLVVTGSGEYRFLAPTGAGPLATGGGFTVAREQLRPDDLVLLYTDGAVERPGRTVAQNIGELARVAGDSTIGRVGQGRGRGHAVERVCEVTLEVLTRISGYADDITLLAAQRVPRIAPLSLRLDAEPGVEARVRAELDTWLGALDVRLLDSIVAQHAVGELVSNVVDHAYRDRAPGPVEVEAHVDATGRLVATVADAGRWRDPDPEPSARGNGLALARGLADELAVVPGPEGTRAVLRHRLARPAEMMADRSPHADRGRPAATPPYSVKTRHGGLTVTGPLDPDNVEDLRGEVLAAGHGGAGPVRIDLVGVTHLGSAAVQMLHELRRDGVALTLLAPAGSVAQHVLELVRLPYRSTS
ncbi:MAG: SpoIIE family protein phosphatase [Marmoricola sp.]